MKSVSRAVQRDAEGVPCLPSRATRPRKDGDLGMGDVAM
jgi:hypothetical protein